MSARLVLLLTAIWALSGPLAGEVRRLTILHSNDLHARLLPDPQHRGGFAQIATIVNRERNGCGHCLFLNAGDLVQGTAVSTIFKGNPVFEIGNLLKFDAFTLGNHEFDYGWRQIPQFIRIARFPIVTANVVNESGKLIAPAPYLIRKVNGIRVAIVGAVMSDLVSGFLTAKTAGPWNALPVVDTIKRYSAELRNKSDLIVVLGHIHPAEADAILENVPEVSLVVEGHNHRGRDVPGEKGGRIAVGLRGYGLEVGRVDLQVDVANKKLVSWDWKRIPVTAEVPPNPAVAKAVAKWEAKVAKIVDVPIAEAKRNFEPPDLKLLVEQAIRDEMNAEVAFTNRGSIRDRLPAGTVRARNLWNIMPFDNMMVIARVPGRSIPKPLLGDQSVDPDKLYTVALPDYVVDNEAQRNELQLGDLKFERTDRELRQLLIDWVTKKKVLQ